MEELPNEFPSPDEATQILFRATSGEIGAESELFEIVYQELRRIADRQMRGQGPGHTLQATALVHEAFLRIFGGGELRFESRQHFLATAAVAMRQVLVDHARGRNRDKRSPKGERVFLDELTEQYDDRVGDLVSLDDALNKLADRDLAMVRLVELRFFGGLSVDDAAEVLGVSPRTAAREWKTAKAWLKTELSE